MRTTIDLPNDLRARVLALAARRGDRGFSRIVQEALERFLREDGDPDRARRVAEALAALGSLPASSAARMRATARHLRKKWRA
jgi:hypothetical protein